jgi:predicted metal-dependent enzyme (double-stranded beta helix superfamily)
MKSLINHESESSSYQVKSARGKAQLLTASAYSQMVMGHIPELSEICQELSNTAIRNGRTTNALQFVPVIKEMMTIEQLALAKFIKNPQTNHVLIENDFLKIVLIHWLPGKISSIHGHPKGGGIFKVISGSIEELRYTSDPIPKLLSASTFHKDAVGYIDDQLGYHAVGNPHTESAISLHVYTRV